MTSRHETLRSAEHFFPREERAERVPGSLDAQSIDQLLMRQAEMLLSIEHDINPAVFEILYSKIESENKILLDFMEMDAKSAQRKAQLSRTLKAEYFTQRRLDNNFI